MSITSAIWLGTVQGLTEFLPVSSSGHLAIAQHFMTGFEQPGLLFDIVLHLGTLGAVLLYFRQDLVFLATGLKPASTGSDARRLIGLLALSTVPIVIMALLFKDRVEQAFEQLWLIGASLCVTGGWLLLTSRVASGKRQLRDVTMRDALIVGLCQSAALLPGISRSGTTIGAGLMRGLEHGAAARFSFLLSIPAIVGATVLNLKDVASIASDALVSYFVGFSTAFVIGYMAIGIVIRFLEKQNFHLFGYYCLASGGAVLGYVTLGNS